MSLPFGPSACQLVAMTAEHSEFVVRLRADAAVGRFLNAGATTSAEQADWIRRQSERPQDHNLIIQRHGQPIGTAALLNGTLTGTADYGRFALLPDSARLLALPAHWLVLRYGFERLGLGEIRWEVREDNTGVVAFHEAFGYSSRSKGAGRAALPEGVGVWQFALNASTFAGLTERHAQIVLALTRDERDW